MALYKRGDWFWMDAVINGYRYREPLKTTDSRKAPGLERERIAQIKDKAPDPTKKSKTIGSLIITDAVEVYIAERSAQVSARMVRYWLEQSRPLSRSKSLAKLNLSAISPSHIAAYQSERLAEGRAPKTVNGEISVLRQLLKHARIWYRFIDEYKPIRNSRPPVGRALTTEETDRLFNEARTRPDWRYAYVAATLAFYCGMRACEIKGLKWKHINWGEQFLEINRSKTPARWRNPSLNHTCLDALRSLFNSVSIIGANDPDHFVFPWHGREQRIDPTRPITSWRSAWRSILKAAGLIGVRFHDGRHTVVTTLAEKGTPDWVIQAQVGHVDPQMMKTYSHIRRQALIAAAAALEPNPAPFPIESTHTQTHQLIASNTQS